MTRKAPSAVIRRGLSFARSWRGDRRVTRAASSRRRAHPEADATMKLNVTVSVPAAASMRSRSSHQPGRANTRSAIRHPPDATGDTAALPGQRSPCCGIPPSSPMRAIPQSAGPVFPRIATRIATGNPGATGSASGASVTRKRPRSLSRTFERSRQPGTEQPHPGPQLAQQEPRAAWSIVMLPTLTTGRSAGLNEAAASRTGEAEGQPHRSRRSPRRAPSFSHVADAGDASIIRTSTISEGGSHVRDQDQLFLQHLQRRRLHLRLPARDSRGSSRRLQLRRGLQVRRSLRLPGSLALRARRDGVYRDGAMMPPAPSGRWLTCPRSLRQSRRGPISRPHPTSARPAGHRGA